MPNNFEFASRLRDAMRAKGVSASSLARQSGVTPTAVWNWETSHTLPRPHTLAAVARVLGVTPEYLLSGTGNGESETAPPKAIDEILGEAQVQIAQAINLPPDRVRVRFEVVSA